MPPDIACHVPEQGVQRWDIIPKTSPPGDLFTLTLHRSVHFAVSRIGTNQLLYITCWYLFIHFLKIDSRSRETHNFGTGDIYLYFLYFMFLKSIFNWCTHYELKKGFELKRILTFLELTGYFNVKISVYLAFRGTLVLNSKYK